MALHFSFTVALLQLVSIRTTKDVYNICLPCTVQRTSKKNTSLHVMLNISMVEWFRDVHRLSVHRVQDILLV
jgi:hypothetical protein